MGCTILWLGTLGATILLQALLIAVASRSNKRFVRVALPAFTVFLYLPIAAAAMLTEWMYYSKRKRAE